jgi:hypothetical protein
MPVEPTDPASQPERRQAFMQALTTEHFTLQTARAVAVNEGNGRTALYIGALSSTLVALALVAQRSPLGQGFYAVALTVLPAVLFLGLVTYVRVLQSSIEDILYARAINRIRHYYTEIDPSRAHYFLLSGRDDVRGALANMCIRDSWTQFLFTMPSAVAVINALLAGVTVALGLVTAAGTPLPATVLSGMASGTTVLALHLGYQVRRFATMKAKVAAVFPSAGPALVGGRRPSEGEEDGGPLPLEVDVQVVAAGHRGREQGRPGRRGQGGQDRVGRVRRRLVGEVDAGHRLAQQPPGEDRQVDMGGLAAAVRPGQRSRLDRQHPEPPLGVGRAAPEPSEAGQGGAAPAVGVGEAALGVGLPGLDQGVGHRVAGAVQQPARQPQRARGAVGHHLGAVGPEQADGEERPDGLGGGGERGHSSSPSSSGVAPRPRRTMSHR